MRTEPRPAESVQLESLSSTKTKELVELARVSLGESPIFRTPEFWNWKHQHSPFGESLGFVARAATGLAGMRVFMRWTWYSQGAAVPCVRAVDTATHPDWRRRGLFKQLTKRGLEDAAENGVRAVFNTPNEKSLPGYLKLGWRPLGRIPLWVKPLRPLRALARLARQRLGGHAFATNPAPLRPAAAALQESNSAAFGAGFTGETRFHTLPTPEYLRWRYADPPGLRYGAAAGARALVIYRLRWRRGLLELSLCEVLANDDGSSQDEAVSIVRELAANTNADYAVAIGASGTPESACFRRSGFRETSRLGPTLVVRPVAGGDLGGLVDLDSWRLSIGAMELF